MRKANKILGLTFFFSFLSFFVVRRLQEEKVDPQIRFPPHNSVQQKHFMSRHGNVMITLVLGFYGSFLRYCSFTYVQTQESLMQ